MTTVPIDTLAAERFLAGDHDPEQRQKLSKFLATHVRDGRATLTYAPCKTGQALMSAGLIEGARVYATSDPFQLPSELNDLLTGAATHNYDDAAAYPTYMRTLTNDAQALELLAAVPRDELDAHYGRPTKKLLHALMMDGGAAKWRREHGVPGDVHEHAFVTQFSAAMKRVTDELATGERAERAIALIKTLNKKRKLSDDPQDPRLTWKSFLLQEVEYKARRAKLKVAGRHATQQEHDGIKVLQEAGDLSEAMSKAASEAIGVPVTVAIKAPRAIELPDVAIDPQLAPFVERGLTHSTAASIFAATNPPFAYAGTGKDAWRACRRGVWTAGDAGDGARGDALAAMRSAVLAWLQLHNERLGADEKTADKRAQAMKDVDHTHFQTAALAQAESMLKQPRFDASLDMNTSLVAFTDGYLMERRPDAKLPHFRKIEPDDRVSKTVGFPHTLARDASPGEIEAARGYVRSLFSDADKGDYLLRVNAVTLFGLPLEEFYMLTGEGSNGKTQFMSLMRAVYGDYFAEVNHTMLTKTLAAGEGPSPFIMALRGSRLVNTAEPGEGDRIEASQLKRMAGNEYLVARALHGAPEPFAITFKMFMSCNDAPDMSSGGESVTRRFRKIDFDLRFCDDPHGPNERRASLEYDDAWRRRVAPALLWLIASQELPSTRNVPMPESVRAASEEHVSTALAHLEHFIHTQTETVTEPSEATNLMEFRASAMAFLRGRQRQVNLAAFENTMARLGYAKEDTTTTGRAHVRAWYKIEDGVKHYIKLLHAPQF